jgi:hypothetical protein
MTMRRWMIAGAAAALLLGGVSGINELDRRSNSFHKNAAYHRQRQEELDSDAAYLEGLATDPSRGSDLAFALYTRKLWSRGQAIAMELECPEPFCRDPNDRWMGKPPTSRRGKQLALEAERIATEEAQACRRMSEYHAQQRRRYERAAFSPWLPLKPDQPSRSP